MRIKRGRTRQLQAHRRQNMAFARQRPNISPCDGVHGVDQQRQPLPFTLAASPRSDRLSPDWLNSELLTHRLLPVCPPALADTNSRIRRRFRTTVVPKKSARCDLLHRSPGPPALNPRNGTQTTPIVIRSATRHRHRLRLDSNRRRGRLDRADLSPSDLIQFGDCG